MPGSLDRLCAPALPSRSSLLGENAFAGVNNGTNPSVSSCMVWMSEAAMLQTRISVSQLVSVCIAGADDVEAGCKEECCSTGTSFVVAIAWPSKKLIKNGVQISKPLAQGLNFPAVGSCLTISCLQVKCSTADIHKQLRVPPCGAQYNVLLQECGKISLEFCDAFRPPPMEQVPEVDRRSSFSTPTKSPGFHSSSPSPSSKVKRESSPMVKNESSPMVTKTDAEHVSTVARRHLQSSDKMKQVLEKLAARWLCGRLLLGGNIVVIPICGVECGFHVKAAEPIDAEKAFNEEEATTKKLEQLSIDKLAVPLFYVGHKTSVNIVVTWGTADKGADDIVSGLPDASQASVPSAATPAQHLYSSIGGLSEEIRTLKEIVEHSLLHPEILTSFGLKQTKGVLLYGPPGTGKTTLAQSVACEAGVKMFVINGPEVVTEYYGESEAALKGIFDTAANHAPALIFIDELDAITPQRKEGAEELGQRLMATLLTLMDTVHLNRVLVIAATNRPESIDSALRRHGRFDHEIEIGVPTPSGRLEILHVHLARMKHSLTVNDIQTLATVTHGFVGADLSALCNEAALQALRRYVLSGGKSGSEGTLNATLQDFEAARCTIRPSAMREVILEVPKVRWSDIGGQADVKQQLKEIVEWPQMHQDSFTRIGTTPPRGVLLYGPPGCSKTMIARAVAAETGLNFIAVKGPELFSKWVGESEKAVRALFKRAKAASPSVIFFDEIDGLAVPRSSGGDGISVESRVMSQLLIELDGITPRNGVSIIAATNRPDKLDSALLRPGRFDRLLFVGPPDNAAREEIFRIHLRRTPCSEDVSAADLASRTKHYTGADIAAVCRAAALAALEEDLNSELVRLGHFEVALRQVLPSKYAMDEAVFGKLARG